MRALVLLRSVNIGNVTREEPIGVYMTTEDIVDAIPVNEDSSLYRIQKA